MNLRFRYSRPQITESDLEAVKAVLETAYLTQGPQIEAFEREFAAAFGCAEAVVCSSGTAALHLACMAADLGPERGLLTSPITFLATANTARMTGAPVVFADVDPRTGNLDPKAARRTLEGTDVPVAAITAVHLAGRPCDMIALRDVADAFGCVVIEDACHAPGAVYRDRAGSSFAVGACRHSDLSVFSFHAIKHIAMGEGGAVCTNGADRAARMRLLRDHGMSRDPGTWQFAPEAETPWYYEMHEIGYNYRVTDMQCALGRSQLRRLEEGLSQRERVASAYYEHLENVPHLRLPPPAGPRGHAWHLFPVAIDFAAVGKTRGQVMAALKARGIGTQVHYIPLYRQPYYRAQGHKPLANAEAYYEATLSLPMYVGLGDADVAEIAAAVKDVLAP